MGSEEWRRKEKKASTTLASWADANGASQRLAGLVADGEASTRVVEILKKCRGSGAALNKAQQTAMLGQLRGAGPWHKDGAAAPTPGKRHKPAPAPNDAAATTNRRARRAASRAAEPAARPAAPGRQARRVALAETEPSEIAVEPDEGWSCTNCTATRRGRQSKCRICQHSRTPAAVPAASPAALSVEELAAKRAGLQACISSMQTYGAMPAAIAERQAALALLDKPIAPPPQPGLSEQLAAATAAETAALAYESALVDKGRELQAKVAEAQADVTALGIALGKAQQQSKEATNKLTAVRRAVGAQDQTAGPAAAPAAPAAPAHATILAAVDATFARQLEALGAPGAEEEIKREMETFAALWGCTLQNGFSMTRYLATRAAAVREEVAGATSEARTSQPPQVGQTPSMAATAPSIAKAPAARPAARPAAAPAEGGAGGESRLPARDSCKQESISETSRTQVAKETCAKAQREEERQARLARNRREKDEIEAEAAADFSDVGTAA